MAAKTGLFRGRRGALNGFSILVKRQLLDEPVKSTRFVMPDLIRHPEPTEIAGFRLTPERRKDENFDFLRDGQLLAVLAFNGGFPLLAD
ncbi:hypothetical protein [Desulfosarcina widdelii]|uniref:hypothetical protein n=1 Tax=Desulfosarcina widdelii TaxID=947919 RepID=UPI0012D2A7AC|nr:hypothetical protein [Desulfosarcina widdelii]